MSRRSLTPAAAHRQAAGIVARARARYGAATMTAPPQQQEQGQGGTGTPPAGGGGEAPSAGGQQAEQQPEPRFTQADLDRIVGERVAAERSKAQRQLEEAQALAGRNETEKLTIERDQAQQRAQEATVKAAERVARTEAKVAAIAAGANPKRVDAIVRNADLAKAVKDGEVDEAAVAAAVAKVLEEYPEWKADAPGSGSGGPAASGGELNGGGGSSKPTFTRQQLEEMPKAEMAARIDEINEAIADGRVTG